ncbi:MAG: hypothetical protein ACYDHP_11990 [Ferrimicrobium sp.]
MVLAALFGAIISLDGRAHYFEWGVIQVSYANLIVIGVMLALFVLALFLPFPSAGKRVRDEG